MSEVIGEVDLVQKLRGVEGFEIEPVLEELAWRILAESKKLVPVDTGFLRSSGEVERQSDGFLVKYTADYALPVHERMDVKHRNGQAKFLEEAVEIVLDDDAVADVLVRHIEEQTGASL